MAKTVPLTLRKPPEATRAGFDSFVRDGVPRRLDVQTSGRSGAQTSKAVVTGDITQVDLPREKISGLRHAMHLLENIEGIGITHFDAQDVIRHPLVKKIVKAYESEVKS